MAADVMVPCVTRSSAASVLNMQYKQTFVYHKKKISNTSADSLSRNNRKFEKKTFLCFGKYILHNSI